MRNISRREALAVMGGALAPGLKAAARPAGYLVECSLHMFSDDPKRFPRSPYASYNPPPYPVEKYVAFVREAKLDHTVLVQSEVYQDDHRYLEYCFTQEPSPGYFKATCLFDPIDPKTPARIQELANRNPNHIVGMRIHEYRQRNQPYTRTGPIRDRDLGAPEMKNTWRKIQEMGMLITMQMQPWVAAAVGALASEFPDTPVLIDHLGCGTTGGGRFRGTPAEYEEVLKLAKLPNVRMKISILGPESKTLIRRAYEAFGPDRLIWEYYGATLGEFETVLAQINDALDFAPENERVKIRGLNAMKVFRFPL
jgi:predicted TIM-barrel fold metal-dependent hydrolase